MKSKKEIYYIIASILFISVLIFIKDQADEQKTFFGVSGKTMEVIIEAVDKTKNTVQSGGFQVNSHEPEETGISGEDAEWLQQKRIYVIKDLFSEIDSAKYIDNDPQLLGAYAEQVFLGICQCPDLLGYSGILLEEQGIRLLQGNRELFKGIGWDYAESVVNKEEPVSGYTVIKERYVEENPQPISPAVVVYWKYELNRDPDLANWWQELGSFQVLAVEKDINEEQQILLTKKIPQMSLREIQAYTEKVFQLLIWEPSKIDRYQEVFDTESIEIWKNMEWCYDRPEEFYDFSASVILDREKDNIIGHTSIDYHLMLYDIDWSTAPFKVLAGTIYEKAEHQYGVVKWTVIIDWEYSMQTGTLSIKKAEIGPNQF